MSQWQPIETAPKDGREVLCWGASFPTPCFLKWKTNPRIIHAHNNGQSQELAATYFGDPDEMDDYDLATIGDGPSHWLAIPDPPTVAAKGVSA